MSRTGKVAVPIVPIVLVTLVTGCTGRTTPAAGGSAGNDGSAPAAVERPVVPVVRQDLTSREELAGWLAHADPATLTAGRDGVVTWMPAVGTVVERGGLVAEIDGIGTRLLIGERPAWRRMAVGEPDGPDIEQLNDNLAALGYAERDDLPDQRFDWRTRAAVSRWQGDNGRTRTGAVEAGDVAFLPAPVRIGSVELPVGALARAGDPLASVTGREQVVTVEVGLRAAGELAEGQLVTVLWPDGVRAEVAIRSIGRAVTGGAPTEAAGTDDPTVTVVVEAPAAPTNLDSAPMVVVIERVLASDVLTVPVSALLAQPGGGYAVERVGPAGAAELVVVEPGRFTAGEVEVTGDLDESDQVVVPL